jgi:hypothetical protein
MGSLVDPARVLRRGLLAWGLGHLALGLRRGWLLICAEVAALALLGVGLVPRSQGTLADVVFCALVLFFVAWAGQAVDAYQRAVERVAPAAAGESGVRIQSAGFPASAARPGADVAAPDPPGPAARAPLLVLLLVVPATVVFTVFWLIGGGAASPTAALQQYVADWRDGDAARAYEHVVTGDGPAALRESWAKDATFIDGRIRALAAQYGPASGLDAERPFASLGFTLEPGVAGDVTGDAGGDTATAAIDIVRQATVHESFLGLFPAASQRSVPVERVGTIRLRLVELPAPFGVGPPDRAWRVERVSLTALP